MPSESRRPPTPFRVALQVGDFDKGGLERVVLDLALGFRAARQTPSIIVTGREGYMAEEARRAGLTVIAVGRSRWAYSLALRWHRPDVILTNHCFTHIPVARRAGIPIIEIVQNYYFWRLADPRMQEVARDSVIHSIAVSHGVADFHRTAFGLPEDMVETIENSVHARGLSIPDDEFHREDDGSLQLVNCANFFRAKALPSLVTAFAKARLKSDRRLHLSLVGAETDPAVSKAVRSAIQREGIEQHVTLTGHVNRTRLSTLLRAADVFVLPSIYEGFSLASLEAALFGLPIVATSVGGAPDLIGNDEAGILIPAAVPDFLTLNVATADAMGLETCLPNTSALTAAIGTMATDGSQLRAKGAVARQRARNYTPERQIARYVATCDRVLNNQLMSRAR